MDVFNVIKRKGYPDEKSFKFVCAVGEQESKVMRFMPKSKSRNRHMIRGNKNHCSLMR